MPRVFVWYVRTADVAEAALLERCEALLLAEEREQHRRFVFERHRHEYLVTRALSRGVLAHHLGARPESLAFKRNEFGRPELDPPRALRFNLTNSTELVACAVTHDAGIGVDTEPLARADQILGIADTVFTNAERAGLHARRGVELWTLKEAYMKARGMGMSLPVKKFEVLDWRLRVMPPIEDVPERWKLSTHEVEDHLVSLCVEHCNEDVVIEIRRADLATLL
jgi:4'-phosphopantetheinyl transferase